MAIIVNIELFYVWGLDGQNAQTGGAIITYLLIDIDLGTGGGHFKSID
jgi:hypothetical protein